MGILWDYWYSPVATSEGVREVATPFKTKARTCTDVVCLLLFSLCLVGWVAVAVIAFIDGDPKKVLYPTNSAGEVCGQGVYRDKPYMMMFDITKCIGLGQVLEGCPSPSVCVSACPTMEWDYKQGKMEGLQEYCQSLEGWDYGAMDIKELIELRLCPAYIEPQRLLFDRCIPAITGVEVTAAPNTTEEAVVEEEQVKNDTEAAMDYDDKLTEESLHTETGGRDLRTQDRDLRLSKTRDLGYSLLPSLAPVLVGEREDDRLSGLMGAESLILPHPRTVLKLVDLRRSRDRREAFLVADYGKDRFKDKERDREGSGAVAAALFAPETEEDTEQREAKTLEEVAEILLRKGNGSYLAEQGNITKRWVNLSDQSQIRKLFDLQGLGDRIIHDLSLYWWILFLYILLSFILSLLWVLLLSCCAKPTVWLSVLGSTIGLSLILAIHSYSRYSALTEVTQESDDIFLTTWERVVQAVTNSSVFWLVLTLAFSTLAVILSLTLGCCMQRLRVATEMISEASKAIRDIQYCLLLPLLPFLLHLLVLAFALTVGIFLLSAREAQYHVISGCDDEDCTGEDGEVMKSKDTCEPETFNNCTTCPEAACVFHRYGSHTLHLVLQWYNLFAALWAAAFVSAASDLILAGAVAAWYWTFKKTELPPNLLGSSIKRSFRYHLGTVAFGSLLLALIQFLRVVVEYLNDRISNLESQNKILHGIVIFLRGCFFFLEKLIKYLNRNAYIMTAMVGSSFCTASKEAFHLITTNILRGFFVNQVADFVIMLGKIFVVGLTTLCFSCSISDLSGSEDKLHFSFIPIVLVMLGSYTVASSCLAVYSVAVDTLFLCFLKDVEINDGGWRKPYYMSKNLMSIMKYENI